MTGRLVIYDWGAFGKTNLKLVLLLVVANDLTVLSVTIGLYSIHDGLMLNMITKGRCPTIDDNDDNAMVRQW